MSRKEFQRGAVLGQVESGVLTLKEASLRLGLSYRQAKRVYQRFREEGSGGLVHRSVGRASNHARCVEERERVVALVRENYGGERERGPRWPGSILGRTMGSRFP
jgi:hypothetical protein